METLKNADFSAPLNANDKTLRVMVTQNLGLMKMNYVAVLFDSHQ